MVAWPVVLVTREAEVRGLGSKASMGKSVRPYLKNKLKTKGLGCDSSDGTLT
jgi:hypothetical protein